jgi:hypothetical protein
MPDPERLNPRAIPYELAQFPDCVFSESGVTSVSMPKQEELSKKGFSILEGRSSNTGALKVHLASREITTYTQVLGEIFQREREGKLDPGTYEGAVRRLIDEN